jgi:glycosyltransferase involved in cell wall biosynthesis
VRGVAERWTGVFLKNITVFVALSEFAKHRFIDTGIPKRTISVIPNIAPLSDRVEDPAAGDYAAFVGRLSPEKGCDLFVSALAKIAHVKGAIAGDGHQLSSLVARATSNVAFKGWLTGKELHEFFTRARFLVLPSRCFEMCPLSVFEAMGHGKPVIVPRIGGLSEFVEDDVSGLLFTPGNSKDLAEKIDRLWQDDALVRRLGRAARQRVEQLYSEDAHYEKLMTTYKYAINACKKGEKL